MHKPRYCVLCKQATDTNVGPVRLCINPGQQKLILSNLSIDFGLNSSKSGLEIMPWYLPLPTNYCDLLVINYQVLLSDVSDLNGIDQLFYNYDRIELGISRQALH